MLINGIDLSSLGIKLYDRVIKSNDVSTKEDWLDGDIQPTSIRQQDGFKSINLAFLILGQDENDAFLKMSKLTQLVKKATIKFDDLDYYFDVSMTGKAEPERLKNGNFIVRYSFTSDYAKGEREIYTTNANLTNAFKLTVMYYQNSTTLLSTDTLTIRASSFKDSGTSFSDIGVDVNKYRPDYHDEGVATNLNNLELTYANMQYVGALIINYAATKYNLSVHYFTNNGSGYYNELLQDTITFTYPQLQNIKSIGQLIDAKSYKPDGYTGKIDYDGELTVEALLLASPIYVLYDKIENERSKTITIFYRQEEDDGSYSIIQTGQMVFKESNFVDGMTLGDIINVDAHRPSISHYNAGYFVDHDSEDLITFNTLDLTYYINYTRAINTIFVEYYLGTYPDWYRITTISVSAPYKNSYEDNFNVSDLNIDLDKYHTSEYKSGILNNSENYNTYDSVVNTGILQVYYVPIDFEIQVQYSTSDGSMEVKTDTITINALDFLGNPILNDIIPLSKYKPEGYQVDTLASYDGEVTLSALTQASPILIVYEEIEAERTKNIIVKYKQEMSSAYATINTSIITVNETDCIGGIRLKDIINLNAYKPEYYDNGILDGMSEQTLVDFDSLAANYSVIYTATYYATPVRYYTDDVDVKNWIGSGSITYRTIDFTTTTTLYDLGLDINAYKPGYAADGECLYTGPVNFNSLRALESINVVYESVSEPGGDDDIEYPHRFLFLQHNDLGDYEHLHPEWTLNHAYINTGVSAEDMSKLTVVVETGLVDKNVPLYNVNAGQAYLFGSSSSLGQFFMRYNNQTQYGTDLTGVNTYEAKAGAYSDTLVLNEDTAVGFSSDSGIYASDRDGYSYAKFTYTNSLATEHAQMPYPLYLFANNNAGEYQGGLAGIGIYSCRIYYDGTLVRDFIPVQFYDKIGDKVAPSNCLYDKVSETFFEDATHQNSFNIIDDDRYTDTNPDHQIGHCMVNYYKGSIFMQSSLIYFRASEFDNGYDVYEKFNVDGLQPAYYKTGYIENYAENAWTFAAMNNNTYKVIYPEKENALVVNYYKQNPGEERVLLETESIALTEADFYQVPTFGDLIRINKYKPEGYETNFQYTGDKVTLARILDNAPYNIVYTPVDRELKTYTTTVRYIKKVYGIRTYETLGTETLTFDETQFRDGEYIDFYINKNLYKPTKFYKDGEPYQWYEMDERLTTPENLRESYTIVYNVDSVFLDVNYYRDSVSPTNLIAATDWEIKIDDFEPGYDIYVIDSLPNNYINKYRPQNCDGGVIQDSTTSYTFEELSEIEEIAIVYPSKSAPHDPESASYEQKMLYWGEILREDYFDECISGRVFTGGRIPYIDLGYKPKEIGRLRMEVKGYARPYGLSANTTSYGMLSDDYLYYIGYYGATSGSYIGQDNAGLNSQLNSANAEHLGEGYGNQYYPTLSRESSGCLAIKCRTPGTSGWVYTAQGPQYVDGQIFSKPVDGNGTFSGNPKLAYTGVTGWFRNGYYADTDDNYNPIVVNHNYGIEQVNAEDINPDSGYSALEKDKIPRLCMGRANGSTDTTKSAAGNPYTVILDAYNSYFSIWRENTSNTPQIVTFDRSEDLNPYEDVCRPKGTLSVFQCTNPDTGKVNIMPFQYYTYPYTGLSGSMELSGSVRGNPYSDSFESGVTTTVDVITGYAADGSPIIEKKSSSKNINFAQFEMDSFPQMTGAAIWSIKIYDQDRLVRDMIPVSKGDVIYDYEMPDDGLFDLVTEIFFGNSNEGGTYTEYGMFKKAGVQGFAEQTVTIEPNQVFKLKAIPDPLIYGKSITNYYDYDNSFLGNQYVDIPTWYTPSNSSLEEVLRFNDYKPDDFHLDGMLDLDEDLSFKNMTLKALYELGANNVYYKLRQFTKTVVYYQDNLRIGSKDLFFSLKEIENANSLADLGLDVDLYYDANYKHGEVIFDESILRSNNIQAFIDAPSPIVVYKFLSEEDNPEIFYFEFYRGGAYDDTLIHEDASNENYLSCSLDGVVLNPNGAIKYLNHYHTALYEDETFDYFIPYQVKVTNKYAGIHRGPARKYPTLAMIIEQDTYTIIQERNGWGRLKEYPIGWILLNQTEPITGPGQNPDYDVPDAETATIPFGTEVHISSMTIDRLWCYIPEVKSWVKAEDISYNQSGKLYNALGIEIVPITTGTYVVKQGSFDVEKYWLRFHDHATYSPSSLTSVQMRTLGHLDIVYPETVYNYTCIYYKDFVKDANEVGRSSFSCVLSDWNPDWDVFIKDCYSTDEDVRTNPRLYRDTELGLTWSYFGFDKNLFLPKGYADGIYLWNPRTWEISGDITMTFNELVRTGSQKVVYPSFTPEFKGFFNTPTYYRLTDPIGGQPQPVNPADWNPDYTYNTNAYTVKGDLFSERLEANISQTWYDKNGAPLYPRWGKITTASDGSYLLNAAPVIIENDSSGNPVVAYNAGGTPIYKVDNDRTRAQIKTYPNSFILNKNWPYDFSSGSAAPYDITWAGSYEPTKSQSSGFVIGETPYYISDENGERIQVRLYNRSSTANKTNRFYIAAGSKAHVNSLEAEYVNPAEVVNNAAHDSMIVNISNYRKSPNLVYGTAGRVDGSKPFNYYLPGFQLPLSNMTAEYVYYLQQATKINYNTNLQHSTVLDVYDDDQKRHDFGYDRVCGTKNSYSKTGAYLGQVDKYFYEDGITPENAEEKMTPADYYFYHPWLGVRYGMVHHVPFNCVGLSGGFTKLMFYVHSQLVNYWVPILKGTPYKDGDGNTQKAPHAGIYDIINGTFLTAPDDYVVCREGDNPYSIGSYYTVIGKEVEKLDMKALKRLTKDQTLLNYPDYYADEIIPSTGGQATAKAGLVVPIKAYNTTVDEIDGTWYESGNGIWFDGKNLEAVAGYSTSYLAFEKQSATLMAPTYLSATPTGDGTTPDETIGSIQVGGGYPLINSDCYYQSGSQVYYFVGNGWIPRSRTSADTIEWNKTYVATTNLRGYFQIGGASRSNAYYYGDRITVTKVCRMDNTWGWTGNYWIRLNADVEEIE